MTTIRPGDAGSSTLALRCTPALACVRMEPLHLPSFSRARNTKRGEGTAPVHASKTCGHASRARVSAKRSDAGSNAPLAQPGEGVYQSAHVADSGPRGRAGRTLPHV